MFLVIRHNFFLILKKINSLTRWLVGWHIQIELTDVSTSTYTDRIDKEEINLYVFSFSMHDWVVSKQNYWLIVTENKRDFGSNV